jgi:tetratricopeptide (TPR) repeat protein
MIFDWDWSAAKSEIDVMKAIDPNDVTTLPNVAAVYAGLFGRFNESIAVYRGMLKRDPLAAVIIHNLAVFLSDAGEFEESVATSRRLLQMHRDYSGESASLGLTLLQLGQKKEALEAIQGESNENARLGALPIIYWAMGRRKDANETLATFKEKYANTDAASVADAYAFRGEIDAAFEWLDRAHRQHEAHMAIVKVDPLLKNLHRDPRYQALLVKMKLDGDGSSPRH